MGNGSLSTNPDVGDELREAGPSSYPGVHPGAALGWVGQEHRIPWVILGGVHSVFFR